MFIGVKDLIAELKPEFDRIGKATKKAKSIISARGEKADKDSIAIERDRILAEWDEKIQRGINIHNKLCKKELSEDSSTIYEGYNSANGNDDNIDKIKGQLINNKTYLEKFLFSNKYRILGYADKIIVKRNTIDIIDNKIVDKIYRSSSFKTDTGFQIIGEKMFEPLEHLDSCNYIDAALQLSLYMYLAWENNKNLKIGSLYIRHIKMNDANKKVSDKMIKVPYMKEEVKKILKYRLLNED